jgi:hypothetical protein
MKMFFVFIDIFAATNFLSTPCRLYNQNRATTILPSNPPSDLSHYKIHHRRTILNPRPWFVHYLRKGYLALPQRPV